jgi:hypothetical protein
MTTQAMQAMEAVPGELPPSPSPSPSGVDIILSGLRAELSKLVAGDLEKNLLMVARLAESARMMLMTIRAPKEHVRYRRHYGSFDGDFGGNAEMGGDPAEFLPPKNPEQFGASAIRQLIELLPKALEKKPSMSEAVSAIHHARELGQTSLADELERRLLEELGEVQAGDISKSGESEGNTGRGGFESALGSVPLASPLSLLSSTLGSVSIIDAEGSPS